YHLLLETPPVHAALVVSAPRRLVKTRTATLLQGGTTFEGRCFRFAYLTPCRKDPERYPFQAPRWLRRAVPHRGAARTWLPVRRPDLELSLMAARRDPLRRELPARDRSAPAHDRPPMEDSTLGNKKGHPRELHGARGEALRRAAAGAVHGSGSRAVPRPRSCSRTNRRPRLPRSPSVRRWCSGKTVGRSTRATAP